MRQAQVLNVFLVVIKREMGTCEGERGILPFSSVMRERRRNLPSPSKKKKPSPAESRLQGQRNND